MVFKAAKYGGILELYIRICGIENCYRVTDSLRYKLRMFGIPIGSHAGLFYDNQYMTNDISLPQSLLSKSHNSICYHRVSEAQDADVIRVGWIQGEYNQADLGTKLTLSTKRRY